MFDFLREWVHLSWEYLKPFFLVFSYQETVVFRNGKYHRTLKPGLHPKMMLFEYGTDVNVKPETIRIPPVETTTKDGKKIAIGAYIEYLIVDSTSFICESNDAITNAHDIASGKLSDTIEDCNWDDIKKKGTKTAFKNAIKEKFKYLGLEIIDVEFIEKVEIDNVYKVLGENSSLLPVRL